jgi:hypothetical protein
MLKISAVYFLRNLEICQDAPNFGQDDIDLVLSVSQLVFDEECTSFENLRYLVKFA